MSLWFVPTALAAVGGLAALVAGMRTITELSLLKAEMARVRTLRPAVVELRRDAAALGRHARQLRHRG